MLFISVMHGQTHIERIDCLKAVAHSCIPTDSAMEQQTPRETDCRLVIREIYLHL